MSLISFFIDLGSSQEMVRTPACNLIFFWNWVIFVHDLSISSFLSEVVLALIDHVTDRCGVVVTDAFEHLNVDGFSTLNVLLLSEICPRSWITQFFSPKT